MDTITHTLGGKDREFRFDMKALSKWCRMEGKPVIAMENVLQDIDMLGFSNLCYWAHRSVVGEKIEGTPDDVIDWFDNDMECFADLLGKAAEQLNLLFEGNADAKKKRPPTKTKQAKARPSTK